jgi:cytochrome c oxidase subunit 3
MADGFVGWNSIMSLGSILTVISVILFLYLVSNTLFINKKYYIVPVKYSKFINSKKEKGKITMPIGKNNNKKMRNYNTHPFHLVDVSPWPLLMSISLLTGALSLVNWLTLGSNNSLKGIIIGVSLILILVNWLKDVVREGKGGYHTKKVQDGLKLGFLIFLITEVLLFVSFFWAFFHSSLNPSIEIVNWPPVGINAVHFLSLPLLNSVLLVSGGFIFTWGHHAFLNGDKTKAILSIILGSILTLLFLIFQYIEYCTTEFTITDSVFGSIFFITTGLHGLHVFMSLLFIGVAGFRIYKDSVTSEHALVLDASLIYYH